MQRKGMLDWRLGHCLVSAIAAISNAKKGDAGLAIRALFGKCHSSNIKCKERGCWTGYWGIVW